MPLRRNRTGQPVARVRPGDPVVRMRGGAVGYGDRPAIQDIDFTLRRGEVTVLLGPNGAGKSTLVRGILGLAPMMAGTLELFGTPADRFRDRHRLGYVPQRHTIVGGVPSTVTEVVASGRLPLRRPFAPARATDRAAVGDALATVGLTDQARSSVATLSGGQQRRVLIARALAADPDVLVMDEPTAGVDAATQRLLADTLTDLTRAGRTLLLVAHELGPLAPLIGRVVVLRDGRITYDGPPVPGGEGAYHQPRPHRPRPPPPARARPRPARYRGRAVAPSSHLRPTADPNDGEAVMTGPIAQLVTPDLLTYGFMQRALLASLLVGVTAPAVGVYLVQRRLALVGDGLGHVALAGVALGVLTTGKPVWTALVAAVAGAVAIELVRAHGRTSGDVALALMFYGGIAAGVVLISRAPGGTPANLNAYLFGAITTTSPTDLAVFAALAAAVLVVTVGLAPRLFAVSNDEEYARAAGLPVLGLNMLLAVLTAATVVISMRVVGLLLISALMVVPVAAAQLLAGSFRGTQIVAAGVGLTVSVAGTTSSYYANTPSGGTIVLLAVGVFAVTAAGKGAHRLLRRESYTPAAVHPAVPSPPDAIRRAR